MSESRFFVLRDAHGVDHADNLQPIVDFGLSLGVPSLGAQGFTESVSVVRIQPANELGDLRARVIPDTRYVETNDPIVAAGILDMGVFDEVDEPKKADVDKARKETKAHVEAMKERDRLVAAGEQAPPDINDPTIIDPAVVGQEA